MDKLAEYDSFSENEECTDVDTNHRSNAQENNKLTVLSPSSNDCVSEPPKSKCTLSTEFICENENRKTEKDWMYTTKSTQLNSRYRSDFLESESCASFFNLHSASTSSDEDDETDLNKDKSTHIACNTIPIGQSNVSSDAVSAKVNEFWTAENKLELWHKPETIWLLNGTSSLTNSNSVKSYPCNNDPSSSTSYQISKHQMSEENISYVSKRAKLVLSGNNVERNQNNRVDEIPDSKSMFYIHNKVSPFIDINNRDGLRDQLPKKFVNRLTGHFGAVNKIEWCAAQYSHLLVSAAMDHSIKIWNVFSKQNACVRTVTHHEKAVKHACWSHNGNKVLSSSFDKSSIVTDAETGKLLAKCDHDNFVSVGKYHPVNFNYFVTGSVNKLLCWDMRNTTRSIRTFKYNSDFGQVNDLLFLQDGSQFFTCGDVVSRSSSDCNIMAWDFRSGVVLSNQIYQERYTCTRLKTHPKETEFVAQTQGNYIAAFSTIRPYKMNKYKRYEGHKVVGYNVGCDFSNTGRFIASGSSDGRILFYDYQYSRKIHQMKLDSNLVCLDVDWHPVLPSTLAVSTWNGDIEIIQ